MFCPRCSTENKTEPHYCRQCGLPLPAVRLALEGRVDEAIKKFRKSETWVVWGFISMVVGFLNCGINAFFHAWQSAIFSGALGFVAGMTLILIGISRVGSGNKLLNPPENKVETETPALNQPERAGTALPPAPITEELRQTPSPPVSVVENTTIKLKR